MGEVKNMICPFCKKEFNKYGIKGHIWRVHTQKGQMHKPAENTKPWNKGKTKETSKRILKASQEIKKTFEEHGHSWTGKKHSSKTKKKMSETRKQMYLDGWEASSCGRAKKYKHESPIAGHITVDGKWELAVANYLDELKLSWKRNTKRFKYINLKGNISTYCPDFWVEEWKTYIEVKGYETDLDKCKWNQFKYPLQIWNGDMLIKLNLINKNGEVV